MKHAAQYIALVFLLCAGTAAGQDCGPQATLPWPAGVDPNAYPANPETGRPLLVQHATAYVGQQVFIDCNACDPEGRPLTVWREDTQQQVILDPNNAVVLVFAAAEPGTVVIPIGVTDAQAEDDPHQKTVIGCYAVTFLPINQPPILAGSVRPAGNAQRVKRRPVVVVKDD